MNPTCVSFFKLESIDVESTILLKAIHPEDQQYILAKLKACIEGQIIADIECRIRRDKYERWLRITPYLFNENGEDLLIGQAEDITAYKANIEVLNNHNNKKNSILNILAHDLAGPIGTISSVANLLARDTAKLEDPKIDRYINMIDRVSKNCIKLIRDFIEREFLESAGVTLLKTRVELNEKFRLTIEEYLTIQNALNIKFSYHSNKEIIYAAIDEDKFMQVINNLISNSLKFTPGGGSIHIYIKENENDILISVADTGIGIPEKYQPVLFDKFTKAGRPGLNGEQSTGLGMSIIKTIVEWHQGKIWFESVINIGTTFYIQIPKE